MSLPPNWEAVRDEVVGILQDLLRLDTTNPPGNETLAAEYVAVKMREVGIEPVVLESEPGRGSVVGRWRGTGEAAPLLLMSHTDVVPAEPAAWAHGPFSGDLADGYVWGRGALDMKCITAAHLVILRLLARQGLRLRRDVVQMAAADEEVGGVKGAGWLVRHHPDLIRAEYALNEGGGNEFPFGGTRFYSVQTAEKGLARFRMRVRGEPGHGSVPRQDNAVVRLAAAVARLGSTPLPLHRTRTVEAMFESIGQAVPGLADATTGLWDETTSSLVLGKLPVPDSFRRMLAAMLRNTATPTVLQAGTKINVIPSLAEALVDGRTLPGFAAQDFLAEVRPIVGDDVELELLDDSPALEADLDSPLYSAIVDVMQQELPGARPSPTLVTGATDAKHVVHLGTRVYGFGPVRYEAATEGEALVHGHNERISVDNLLFMTRVLYNVVTRFGLT